MRFFAKLSKYTGTFFAIVIGVVVLAGGSLLVGYKIGTQHPENVIVKGITNIGDSDVTADFSLFWQVWRDLKDSHINGKEAKDQDLVYGAVSGMVGALGDPYTQFFKPEDSKKFEEDISGSFGGIGAEIGMRQDILVIISPLKDSPAERIGLKPGDKILEIDGKLTNDLTVDGAVKIIRGPLGTKVTLTIFRDGFKAPQTFAITRETIRIPTIDAKKLDDGIFHIKLYSFNEQASKAFYEAAVQAVSENSKGIILDLRNNPGGFLEVAVDLAGWFLKKGEVVVKEEFREEYVSRNQTFNARGNEAFLNTPVVVLMNSGSASASEILAGALRDNRKIQLIGEQSFGKGTVQELKTVGDDGSKLKVTIAHWVMPGGMTLEKGGLKPDHEVKITETDIEAGKDPQLEKAIEVLKKQFPK